MASSHLGLVKDDWAGSWDAVTRLDMVHELCFLIDFAYIVYHQAHDIFWDYGVCKTHISGILALVQSILYVDEYFYNSYPVPSLVSDSMHAADLCYELLHQHNMKK
jgi:hypothetical protein